MPDDPRRKAACKAVYTGSIPVGASAAGLMFPGRSADEPAMVLERLVRVLSTWASTGRFPREEFRMRAPIAVAGALFLLVVAIVAADQLLAG